MNPKTIPRRTHRGTTTHRFVALSTLAALSSVECGWIDPDTPTSAYSTRPLPLGTGNTVFYPYNQSENWHKTGIPRNPNATIVKDDVFELVMSDEFNVPGRNFTDGHDPKWTALNKNDYTNEALHFYSHDEATTNEDGELVVTARAKRTVIVGTNDVTQGRSRVQKNFTSAMIQSWNKFCITGGIIEIEATLPGDSKIGGLWPSLWLLGNLSRHTYVATSNHMWPFANPSACQKDLKDKQLFNACMSSVHYGLIPEMGRGAPEIDIFEIQAGDIKAGEGSFSTMTVGQPYLSASYQLAPGRDKRPHGGYWPGPDEWYREMLYGKDTSPNINFYGAYNHFSHGSTKDSYWSDAISFNRQINEKYFGKGGTSHVYRLEWELPDQEKGEKGHLRWFVDGNLILSLYGESLESSGRGTEISSEPSSIVINTAISSNWGFNNKCDGQMCPCEVFDCLSKNYQHTCGFSTGFCDMVESDSPPEFKINSIRVYQNPNDEKQKVGCSTPERPTATYIKAFQDKFKEPEDDVPLRPVENGGGKCDRVAASTSEIGPRTCGGAERGACAEDETCDCVDGWTGPFCLVPAGYDDVSWHEDPTISFHGPSHFSVVLSVVLVVVACALVVLNTRSVGGDARGEESAPLVARGGAR